MPRCPQRSQDGHKDATTSTKISGWAQRCHDVHKDLRMGTKMPRRPQRSQDGHKDATTSTSSHCEHKAIYSTPLSLLLDEDLNCHSTAVPRSDGVSWEESSPLLREQRLQTVTGLTDLGAVLVKHVAVHPDQLEVVRHVLTRAVAANKCLVVIGRTWRMVARRTANQQPQPQSPQRCRHNQERVRSHGTVQVQRVMTPSDVTEPLRTTVPLTHCRSREPWQSDI